MGCKKYIHDLIFFVSALQIWLKGTTTNRDLSFIFFSHQLCVDCKVKSADFPELL